MDRVASAWITAALRLRLAAVVVAVWSAACGDNLGWKHLDEADRDIAYLGNSAGGIYLVESAFEFFQGAGATLHAGPYEPRAALVARDGDCEVWVHPGPFLCHDGCNSGNCVGPDRCAPYPARLSAGTITVSGLVEPLRFQPSEYGYAADPGITGAEIFSPGAVIVASAAGEAVPGFTLEAAGVTPLEMELPEIRLEDGVDEVVRWRAAGDGRIQLVLQVGHHGRPYDARLVCETADDGELTISGDLIASFHEVPVHDELQHPSWMARFTRDVVDTEVGPIELFVASQQELH